MEQLISEAIMTLSAPVASELLELAHRVFPKLHTIRPRIKQMVAAGVAASIALLGYLGQELIRGDAGELPMLVLKAVTAGGLAVAYHHLKRGGKQ